MRRKLSIERFHRLPGLQHCADRLQILEHVRAADAGEQAPVAAGKQLTDRLGRRALEGTNRGLMRSGFFGISRRVQRRLEIARRVGRTVTDQPLPDRLQRRAANLARPPRKTAVDQERFQRAKQ